MGHDISCKEVTILLSRSYEKDIAKKQNTLMQEHLSYCENCRIFQEQLKTLTNIPSFHADEELTEEQLKRLEEAVKKEIS